MLAALDRALEHGAVDGQALGPEPVAGGRERGVVRASGDRAWSC
jgi:hypothetical protein